MVGLVMGATLLSLPLYQPKPAVRDWLIDDSDYKARVCRTERGLALTNGLVTREFHLPSPQRGEALATISLYNLSTGEELLRATGPEATFTVDGKEVAVGGAEGQPDRAYLTDEWVGQIKPIAGSLLFDEFGIGETAARFDSRTAQTNPDTHGAWPPKGATLVMRYRGRGLEARVHYELYDGIPLLSKWITLTNLTGKTIRVDRFEAERISLVEGESSVEASHAWRTPPISVLTDYSFGGGNAQPIHWEPEPEYATQVNYELKTPCRLSVRPPVGPAIDLKDKQSFDTFRVFELLQDGTDRERQGLAVRRMYRILAPWVQDNPIMLHLTSTDPTVVHTAIDQAADCGFEMIVISFWSGLDMEDVSPENLAKFKGFADYAHSKGLRLGGYSLLASRHIDEKNDVVNPKPIFGASPCLGSEWGIDYFRKLKTFLTGTGFDLLEHDGSYPGDTCASTVHPGHRDLDDSQWAQYQVIADFYRWCRAKGVFLNVPDNYFLVGSNKTGMGYRETNWSLPRAQQHIHARQNLFDGTWEKPPSMGWMMVPLVEYQGGGPAATIEPLHDHLTDYGLHLANNFGYGAQACYRGPRLYDSPETRSVVLKWVGWFKAHREILESDVIHVRRADGRHLDAVLHVNPKLKTKAMAVIYNPLDVPLTEEVTLPLYYAGLHGNRCRTTWNDGRRSVEKCLDDRQRLTVKPTVPGRSCVWVTFE